MPYMNPCNHDNNGIYWSGFNYYQMDIAEYDCPKSGGFGGFGIFIGIP